MDVALSSITESEAFLTDDLGTKDEVAAPRNRLCGRAKHKESLLGAYNSVKSTHKSKVVCVHGISGSGKTSLVYGALRKKICEERVMGTFVRSSTRRQVLRSHIQPS